MNRRLAVAGISGLLIASMSLSACGQRSAEPAASAPGSSSTKVAKIALVAPLSGGLSAFGAGMRNSLDLAVKQANETNAVPGWQLELVAEDDQASPDAGKNAATKITSDPEVIGAVGPLNSSVGQAIQPIFESAGMALVSPANTNPTLTKGPDLNNPKRAYQTYFRTCTTDAIQGPFAAKHLLDSGITEVATIHDKKAYGQGLVTAFSEAFTAGGGTVVAAETINPDDKDFSAVVAKVKAANPKAVYYGGEYPQSGPLSQQMKGAGLAVPLMGGDGMYDPAYVELAGSTSEGDLVTSVGAPTESLASAQAFVDAYKAEGYKEGWAAYGMYTYDAGNAIVAALKTSLADATDVASARQATVEALAKVDFEGASGRVAFDEFGDSKARVLTVYRVEGGMWKAAKTEDFQ
ncbi:MAG: branched-chain amino acid ABC transporter substrate-binding protein [Actinomycetes bacterium]